MPAPVRQIIPDYSSVAQQGQMWGNTVSQLGNLAGQTFQQYQGIKREENETNQLRTMIKQTFLDPQNMELYGLDKQQAKALVSRLQNMPKEQLTQTIQNFRLWETKGKPAGVGLPNPFVNPELFNEAVELSVKRKHGADVSQAAQLAAGGGAQQYPGGQLTAPGAAPPETNIQGPPQTQGPAQSESQFLQRFGQLAPEGATAKEALGTPQGAAFASQMKEQKAQKDPTEIAMQEANLRIKELTAKIKEADLKKKTSPNEKLDVPNFNQINDDYAKYTKMVEAQEKIVQQAKQDEGPMSGATVVAEANLAAMKEMQKSFKKAIIDISSKANVQTHLAKGPEEAEKAKQDVYSKYNTLRGVVPVGEATPQEAWQQGQELQSMEEQPGSTYSWESQAQPAQPAAPITAQMSILGNRPPSTSGLSSGEAQLQQEIAALKAGGEATAEEIEAYRIMRRPQLVGR